ncbi:hypothetical protein AB0M43_24060 [Longispora sp. NPDC051575]|uniref:endonuclease III domain-containing protein n=1 Tax=Longispora sp. NPDC051575 TaxID=3154943 RepID=UPI00343C5D31
MHTRPRAADAVIDFRDPVDLAGTMDIQIPALAWTADGPDRWRRVVHLPGGPVDVAVTEHDDQHKLAFWFDHTRAAELVPWLRRTFAEQVRMLDLIGRSNVIDTLAVEYSGVVVMWADPFEALILTMLSQNRSGENVRAVFPNLAAVCGGITPQTIASLDLGTLTETIRSSGPYKAPRMATAARQILDDGGAQWLADRLTRPGALDYLCALPGVAHKTAACVLVFGVGARSLLPVDVHLHRAVARLGLVPHDGKLTVKVRDQIVATLLGLGPDLAPAHFIFLLLGRSTCTAGTPDCASCFLESDCPYPRRERP